MDLALRTTASPTAIWVIVVVAVVCLAFWLAMVMVYANRPDPRNRRAPDMARPALDGSHMAAEPELAQVPGQRGPAAPAEPAPAAGAAGPPAGQIPAQGTAAGDGGLAETTRHPGARGRP